MNVEEMGFSTRTQNALKRNGIHRMEQLQGLGLSELLSLRGIGVRAAAEIQRKGSAVPRKPTKQELSQFLALKKEAESYQKRLRELEKDTASDPVEMGKNPGEVPGSQDALPQGDTVAGGFFADHPGQPVAAYLCQAVSGGQKLAGSGLCHRPLR